MNALNEIAKALDELEQARQRTTTRRTNFDKFVAWLVAHNAPVTLVHGDGGDRTVAYITFAPWRNNYVWTMYPDGVCRDEEDDPITVERWVERLVWSISNAAYAEDDATKALAKLSEEGLGEAVIELPEIAVD